MNRLEQLVSDLVPGLTDPHAPGVSVAVIDHAKVLFAAFGLADLARQTPCTPDTNFRLASLTKQFTAMAVMILAEAGRLSFSETLPDFFPEFPAFGRRITVRQLLNHTSGLPDYERLIPQGTTLPVLDRDVLRLLLKQQRTLLPLGKRYRYSNTGYALLALIVEARSGQTFASFLKRHIFGPLKMDRTLAYEPGSSTVPDRAYGYSRRGRRFKLTDQNLTSSVLGDGGVYSSVADLVKWDRALYTTRLVSRKLLETGFTPFVPSEFPGSGYGFGWFIGTHRGFKEVWHYGDSLGFTTRISRFPEAKLSVIVLANRTAAPTAELPHQLAAGLL